MCPPSGSAFRTDVTIFGFDLERNTFLIVFVLSIFVVFDFAVVYAHTLKRFVVLWMVRVIFDRHRGSGCPLTPATPPCVRVRTRRFEMVTLVLIRQRRE